MRCCHVVVAAAKVVTRGVFIFTDTTKPLETIPEECEEDDLGVEVEVSISTTPTSPATSPPSPDAPEEQYGTEIQVTAACDLVV